MEITEYIPKEKFSLWLDIFKSTSGRFAKNPFDCFNSVIVSYTFIDCDDYTKLNAEWKRLNTPIVEARRGFWKKLKKKIGL